ncbi:ABC transporter permease [Hypericibacter sp.]|uniref:ABC transporter permease n=1 Tax=Hypericibacter sp. TaxID=2705401 RepID=UPI003D6CE715
MSDPTPSRPGAPESSAIGSAADSGPVILMSGHAHAWSRAAFATAFEDIRDGVAGWRISALMGWSELRRRYHRSLLGPFWITLSMAIFILLVGGVFSQLSSTTLRSFMPYVATGYVTWLLLASFVSDGCSVFIAATRFLRQMRLPKSTFVLAMVWRDLMVFAHNLPVVLIILALCGVRPTLWTLMLIPAVMATAAAGTILGLVLGMVASRFRDLIPIVTSLLQLTFFLTPVLYEPGHLGQAGTLLYLNPATHFIGIMRSGFLGEAPSLLSWLAVLGMLAAGAVVSFLLFVRFRARITYWV